MLDFRSDNTACVAPQLIDALHAANAGVAPSYGEESLAQALKDAGGWPHRSQPEAVNLVQATELGEVYQVAEVCEVTKVARAHDLKVHMDGARLRRA